MAATALPPGIGVRRWERRDGTITESYTVRWHEPDGTKRRRSFDTLDDALDFHAKRRSARRWRPEELRQEQAGRLTLGEFFDQWWRDHAMVELKRATLAIYRCLWEAHAEPRLAAFPLRDIDARRVVTFRGELLAAGVGPTSIVKTMSMLQRVFRDAVEYGEVAFNPFKAVQKPSPGPTREAHPFTPLEVERLALDLDSARSQRQPVDGRRPAALASPALGSSGSSRAPRQLRPSWQWQQLCRRPATHGQPTAMIGHTFRCGRHLSRGPHPQGNCRASRCAWARGARRSPRV